MAFRLLFVYFLLEFFCLSLALGDEVLIVTSRRIAPYQEAADGVEQALLAGKARAGKTLLAHTITRVIPEGKEISRHQLQTALLQGPPDIAVAIGNTALELLSEVATCPIVYLLAFPPSIKDSRQLITGIDMRGSPEAVLTTIGETFPAVKQIGLLFDPSQNRDFAAAAQAASTGLTVRTIPVSDQAALPAILAQLKGQVDALWLIPDTTVISPLTMESFVHFSIENRIPLITFAEKHLQHGATAAMTAEPYDQGEQAGNLVAELLQDRNPRSSAYPPRAAEKMNVTVNMKIYHMVTPKK